MVKRRTAKRKITAAIATPADRAAAGYSDQLGRIYWIHGDNSATECSVSTHAPAPEDLAQFGRGLYLEITGPKSGDAPLSKAVKLKDGSVCLYLDPQAKMQLFEQLQRSVLIVSLHEAMAAEKNKPAAVPMQRRRAGQ